MSFLYFILGLCPILWLIFALTVLGWPTYKAAFGSLIISVLLSVAIWQQSFLNTMMAACEGFLMALWPIIVVIIEPYLLITYLYELVVWKSLNK